eukprot:31282-Pelagococcus_subviridis.AAC.8
MRLPRFAVPRIRWAVARVVVHRRLAQAHRRGSEVDQFQHAVVHVGHDQVRGLDVPVNDPRGVKTREGAEELLHRLASHARLADVAALGLELVALILRAVHPLAQRGRALAHEVLDRALALVRPHQPQAVGQRPVVQLAAVPGRRREEEEERRGRSERRYDDAAHRAVVVGRVGAREDKTKTRAAGGREK